MENTAGLIMDVYKGEIDWIENTDIDGPLATITIRWPQEYTDAYATAGAKAKADSRVEDEAVYRFLQRVLSIHPSYESSGGSYVAMRSNGNTRTEIPSDLTDKDAAAISKIITRTTDIALQARLHDLLFVRTGKDYKSAAQAAPLMLTASEALAGKGEAIYLKEGLLRSIQLAKRTGWRNEIGEQVRETVIRVARESASAADDTELLFMLRLVREQSLGDALEWRALANETANKLTAAGKEHHAQMYLELALAFSQALQDVEGEHAVSRAIGETFVQQAQTRATGKGASYMAAAGLLRSGIEALQRGNAPKKRIEELQSLLKEYQGKISGELASTGGEIDISKSVESTRKHVSGQQLGTALLRLAFGAPLVDPEGLRNRVLDLAKDNPLLFLIDTQVVDGKGKPRQIQRGILDLEGESFEKALRLKMMAQAAMMDWSLRAQAQIEPARQVVFTEHHPTRDDLALLVLSNPFIPPGHEGLVARGLLAGFESDFVTSAHLLVPQFEACFRHVLEAHGVHLTKFDPDGSEPYKLWGGMLDSPKTKEIFGDAYILEIEGILLNEAGYNFRNKLAHGMLTEMGCISVPAVTAWWLMLRLCLQPVADRFHGSAADDSDADQDTDNA